MAQFNATFDYKVVSGNILTGMKLKLTDTSNYGATDTPLSEIGDFIRRGFEVRDGSNNILFQQDLTVSELEVEFNLGGLLTLQPVYVVMSFFTIGYATNNQTSKGALLVGVLPPAM